MWCKSVGFVCWLAPLLILRSVGFLAYVLSVCSLFARCLLGLQLTVSDLAKVAIFTTNVDAENQTFINHKCFCGALNRHFCQTRVSTSCFSHAFKNPYSNTFGSILSASCFNFSLRSSISVI
jgi:hypothetical protein